MIILGHRGAERIPLPRTKHSENGKLPFTEPWNNLRTAVGNLPAALPEEYIEFRDFHKQYLAMLSEDQYWKNLSEDIAREAMGKSYELGGGKTGFYRRLNYNEPSPTLVTSPTMPATTLCHPIEVRPLSIKGYARN